MELALRKKLIKTVKIINSTYKVQKMKLTTLLFALTSLFLSTVATAHVHLGETIPAENAMLLASPSNLSLTFSGDIALTKVTIIDANKNIVEFGFTPSAISTKAFNWKLPMLSDGQ